MKHVSDAPPPPFQRIDRAPGNRHPAMSDDNDRMSERNMFLEDTISLTTMPCRIYFPFIYSILLLGYGESVMIFRWKAWREGSNRPKIDNQRLWLHWHWGWWWWYNWVISSNLFCYAVQQPKLFLLRIYWSTKVEIEIQSQPKTIATLLFILKWLIMLYNFV